MNGEQLPVFGPTGVQNVHDDQGEPFAVVRLDVQVSRAELFAALVCGFTEVNVDRDPDLLTPAEVRAEVEAYLASDTFTGLSRAAELVEAGAYTGPQLRRLEALRRAMDRAYPVRPEVRAPGFSEEFPQVAAHLARERGEATVTVRTSDHGRVEIVEPAWCVSEHPDGVFRADIEHEGEEQPLVVDTPGGRVQVATASLYQRPLAEESSRAVVVTVEFGTEANEYDSVSLAGLADALVVFAVGPLHRLIERLQRLEGGAS